MHTVNLPIGKPSELHGRAEASVAALRTRFPADDGRPWPKGLVIGGEIVIGAAVFFPADPDSGAERSYCRFGASFAGEAVLGDDGDGFTVDAQYGEGGEATGTGAANVTAARASVRLAKIFARQDGTSGAHLLASVEYFTGGGRPSYRSIALDARQADVGFPSPEEFDRAARVAAEFVRIVTQTFEAP